MVAALLAVLGGLAAQSGIERWTRCDGFDHFVELVGRDGAAYQATGGSVVFLGATGRVERKVQLPAGCRALYWSEDNDLVCGPAEFFKGVNSGGKLREVFLPMPMPFAQGNRVFLWNGGFVYLDGASVLSRADPGFVRPSLAGVGVSSSGGTMAFLSCPTVAPLIDVAKNRDGVWEWQTTPVAPFIRDLGGCVLEPTRSDVRMVGEEVAVYWGRFGGAVAPPADRLAKFESSLPEAAPAEVVPPQSRRAICYLFATNLHSRDSVALCKLSTFETLEGSSGSTVGRMTASADGRFLYVAAHGAIIRLAILDLLKRSGLVGLESAEPVSR